VTRTLFTRPQPEPALVAQAGGWHAESVTTPDVLVMAGQVYCYVGAVTGGHERIVGFPLPADVFQPPVAMGGSPARLAIDVGPPGSFDGDHVMDPATVVTAERVLLYYSAIGPGPDSIGLATSLDGVTFVKCPHRVLVGRAPEIIKCGQCFCLLYVRATRAGGYAIHLARSTDGVRFDAVSDRPVFDAGRAGSWDAYSVTTPRVFGRGSYYYMVYAGDNRTRDEPRAFGLARSRDCLSWTRYAGNPVFRCGEPRSWDDGAIWFGTVFEWHDTLYLFYEGASGAALRSPRGASAVGVALCSGAAFDRSMDDWRGG